MARTALTDAATPTGQQPLGLSGFGDPVFSDEFSGSSLNRSKWEPWYPDTPFWNTTSPGGHKTNSAEPQGYDESGITFPGSSIMRLTLREGNDAVPELDYTSGMVSSGGHFSQAYGVWEGRLKHPDVTGSWGGFWLFPASDSWDYEIDIVENWGRESWNTQTLHTVHTRDGEPTQSEFYTHSPSVGAAWHTYTLWWEPNRIRMYVDGHLTFDRTSEQMRIYDEPMYVQCNLAGDRQHLASLAQNVPFNIDVDYIRVWENASGSEAEVPETPTSLAYLGSQPVTLRLGSSPAQLTMG